VGGGFAREVLAAEIHQHERGVGAAADEIEAVPLQRRRGAALARTAAA